MSVTKLAFPRTVFIDWITDCWNHLKESSEISTTRM